MNVFLNEQGWNDGTDPLGVWSNQADAIEADSINAVDVAATINTKKGNDELIARNRTSQIPINIINTDLNTGKGDDRISGVSIGNTSILIDNSHIRTGQGDDDISAFNQAGTGISLGNNSTIVTGKGNDRISGSTADNSGTGIFLSGNSTIYTGKGNDEISGSSEPSPGIFLNDSSAIYTGGGNDKISGSGDFTGIFLNDNSAIHTGKGDDVVDALTRSRGFSGSGSINLGRGKDRLEGFLYSDFVENLDSGIFNGGKGEDTLVLPSGSYEVSLGESKTVSFIQDNKTLNTVNFEILSNPDGSQTFDFASLMDSEIIDL